MISSLILTAQQHELDLRVFLSGPYKQSLGTMDTSLYAEGAIPLDQPYNTPPWNYNGIESVPAMPVTDVVDWVLIELRQTSGSPETALPDSMIHRQAGFLLKDGTVVGTDGVSNLSFDMPVTGNLFIIIRHRNHLDVMSAGPAPLNGVTYAWDFTTGQNQAYGAGNAQKLIDTGLFGMYSGDAHPDGQIDLAFKALYYWYEGGNSGYLRCDVNLSGQPNSVDINGNWRIHAGHAVQFPD